MNKKRILIIPSWYPTTENGIVGSFFREQAMLMHENGFDVRILLGRKNHVGRKGILPHLVKNLFKSGNISLCQGNLLQDPPALSFSINQSHLYGEKRNMELQFDAYREALQKMISDGWKPDFIHAQCTVDAGIVAHNLSAEFNIPYGIIEHQPFMLHLYSSYKQKLIKVVLENAYKVGAVSNHQKRCILMHGIKCKPLIIWNLINEKHFENCSSIKEDTFRIMTITYGAAIKDAETFFRAAALFHKDNPGRVEFLVIGNDNNSELKHATTDIFNKLAAKYNISADVKLLPFVLRKDLPRMMSSADVFVSTSIAETFGVAVREAMYCGIPVIATKSGGVEDSINDKTGVIVNIGDAEEIAKSLTMIKNQTLSFDKDYIRNFAISQCGTESFIKSMSNFYN